MELHSNIEMIYEYSNGCNDVDEYNDFQHDDDCQ